MNRDIDKLKVILPEAMWKMLWKKCEKPPRKLFQKDVIAAVNKTIETLKKRKHFGDYLKEVDRDGLLRAFHKRSIKDKNPGCNVFFATAICELIHGSAISLSDFCERNSIPRKAFGGNNDVIFLSLDMLLDYKAPKPIRGSLQKLIQLSEQAISDLEIIEAVGATEQKILLSNLYVERECEAKIANCATAGRSKFIVVQGEAGYGKTSLLWSVRRKLSILGYTPVFLKATMLNEDDIRLGLNKILQGDSIIILLDTIDLLLHKDQDRDRLLSLLQTLQAKGVPVIATCRPQEYQLLKTATLATERFILTSLNDQELDKAVGSYARAYKTEQVINEEYQSIAQIKALMANNKSMLELCRSPLTLWMLFSLYRPNEIPPEINVFKLYRFYWDSRVVKDIRKGAMADNEPDLLNQDMSHCVSKIALLMLSVGSSELKRSQFTTALKQLSISDRDLRILIGRGVLVKGDFVSFFHQTFFEHSAAQAIVHSNLKKGMGLVEARMDYLSAGQGALTTELFILPVVEQLLLLAATSTEKRHAEQMLLKMIEGSNPACKEMALYTYALFDEPSLELSGNVLKVLQTLPRDEAPVTHRFINITPSVDIQRMELLLGELGVLWDLNDRKTHYRIIEVLEYLTLKDCRKVLVLFEEKNILLSVVRAHGRLSKERGAEIYKSIIRILFVVYKDQPNRIYDWIKKFAGDLNTAYLFYALDLLQRNYRLEFADMEDFLIEKIFQAPNSHKFDRAVNMSSISKHWLRLWANQPLYSLLNEIETEKDKLIQSTKIYAVALLSPNCNRQQTLDIYAFFTKHKRSVEWCKILLKALLESSSQPSFLLDCFFEPIVKDIKNLSQLKTDSYEKQICEAFFHSSNVNPILFESIDKSSFLDIANWTLLPRLIDIYVSAVVSSYKPAEEIIEHLLQNPEFVSHEKILRRLYANLMERKIFHVDLVELVIAAMLRTGSAASDLARLLAESLNKHQARTDNELRAALSNYNDAFWEFIVNGINKNEDEREIYGKIWYLCIIHSILPKPDVLEVKSIFGKPGRRNSDAPVLILLLSLCQTNTFNQLDEVVKLLKEKQQDYGRIAQESFLRVVYETDCSIKEYQNDIIKYVLEDWKEKVNDDKAKLLNNIITKQSSSNPDVAFELLYSFVSSPTLKSGKDVKKNDVMRNACISVFLTGSDVHRKKLLALIPRVDTALARTLVDAACYNREVMLSLKVEIEFLAKHNKTPISIRSHIASRLQARNISGESEWNEILQIL